MIPLTTLQGLSARELKRIIAGRSLYIWGSGPIGRGVLTSFQHSGIGVTGFADGRPSQKGKSAHSLPVCLAEDVVKNKKAFLVIANLSVQNHAEELCRKHGRSKPDSYITHYQVQRPEAAIDVAGICNIKCPSCPQGNMDGLIPEGIMPLETYKKVLGKLLSELPHLVNVDLQTWGEPLLNPEIASIIEFTVSRVPCTVSTNLMVAEKIEEVLQAKPSQLSITVNGYEDTYEANMKGASWDTLLRNLQILKACRDRQAGRTTIVITAYSYHPKSEPERTMKKLADELGFQIAFGHRYLNPYEHYAQYCRNAALSKTVKDEIRNSEWDIERMLELAVRDKDRPCLCQRVFPIVNWDTSVSLCHVYYGPIVSKSYLKIPWKELLHLRHQADQCTVCQEKGLHRLDIDVLNRRYGFKTNEDGK